MTHWQLTNKSADTQATVYSIYLDILHRQLNHPFSSASSSSVVVGLEQAEAQLSKDKRWCTPWTGRQSVVGLTIHSHIHT